MLLYPARWSQSIKDFLEAVGVHSALPANIENVESIRQIMLDIVRRADPGKIPAIKIRLTYRIDSCRDVQDLWYFRSEVMQLLSATNGELEARRQLDTISALFKGLLPPSLNPRPAFLQGGERPKSRPR
jgi:hypothetical protein